MDANAGEQRDTLLARMRSNLEVAGRIKAMIDKEFGSVPNCSTDKIKVDSKLVLDELMEKAAMLHSQLQTIEETIRVRITSVLK